MIESYKSYIKNKDAHRAQIVSWLQALPFQCFISILSPLLLEKDTSIVMFLGAELNQTSQGCNFSRGKSSDGGIEHVGSLFIFLQSPV